MFFKRSRKGFAASVIPALLFIFLVHAGFAAQPTDADRKAFLKAVDDVKGAATPQKVSKTLVAIVPPPGWQGEWPDDRINRASLNGGKLSWEGVPGSSRVRVAAFMSRADYETYYRENLESGQPTYTLRKSLWVSAVPELRNRFWLQGPKACPPSTKRVVQLLGLNPGRYYDVILEMFVDPKDLFRPSPDPEITDHRAEIAVKSQDGSWIFPNPFLANSSSDKLFVDGPGKTPLSFQEWFQWNAANAYSVDIDKGWGAPWTRLGYTYDWGKPTKHKGISEFIVRVHPYSGGTGGEVTITLVRAIRSYNDGTRPANWDPYFRCRYHLGARINSDFIDEDVNPSVLSSLADQMLQ
jgi:hypothetical protein